LPSIDIVERAFHVVLVANNRVGCALGRIVEPSDETIAATTEIVIVSHNEISSPSDVASGDVQVVVCEMQSLRSII
jgi:hypothetical protein